MTRSSAKFPVFGLTRAALLAGACFTASPALAQLEYGAGAGLEFSDNVARTSTDETSETVRLWWLAVGYSKSGSVFSADIAADYEHRDYSSDTFDSEDQFVLDLALSWELVPRAFTWVVEDYFRQIRVNALGVDTPGNLQDSNVFWTGPDTRLRFSSRHSVGLDARYGRYYYEEFDSDHDRYLIRTDYTWQLDSRRAAGIEADVLQVRYDEDAVNLDYERYNLYGRYVTARGRTDYQIDLGVSHLELENGFYFTGPLLGLRMEMDLAGENTAGVILESGYTDSGASLLAEAAQPLVLDVAGGAVSLDPRYSTRLDVFYSGHSGRNGIDAGLAVVVDDYEVDDQDQSILALELGLNRVLRPNLDGTLAFEWRVQDYNNLDRTDRDFETSLGLVKQLGRRISLSTEIGHAQRQSNQDGFDYQENFAVIELSYGERP